MPQRICATIRANAGAIMVNIKSLSSLFGADFLFFGQAWGNETDDDYKISAEKLQLSTDSPALIPHSIVQMCSVPTSFHCFEGTHSAYLTIVALDTQRRDKTTLQVAK